MYQNYKIVCNTAAGRRRYMQYLVPFIISNDIVDRYDIWINTHDGADIEFFKKLSENYSKVNLIWQPDGIVSGVSSINAFYKQCVEMDAIYFKLDDDIIWMEPDAIEKMVRFRLENPDYWCVSPLVINNALSSFLLEQAGKIKFANHYECYSNSSVMWRNGKFAADLLEWFLKYIKNGKYSSLYVGEKPMAMARFSINSILWFGKDMAKFDGIVSGDDEEFMSVIYPCSVGRINCWNGNAIMAHFAFFPQREYLDKRNILGLYGDYLLKEWEKDEKMKEISNNIQNIMLYISEHEKELLSNPSPYRKCERVKKSGMPLKQKVTQGIKKAVLGYYAKKQAEHDLMVDYIIES